MNERLFAIVSGRVQMVMFRDFVERKASAAKLAGQVRNLPDGTVEVIAEGPREKLKSLIDKLHQGPLLAHVEQVTVKWHSATGEFKGFKIAYE